MASQALEQMLENTFVPTVGQDRMYQTIDVYVVRTTVLYTAPPGPSGINTPPPSYGNFGDSGFGDNGFGDGKSNPKYKPTGTFEIKIDLHEQHKSNNSFNPLESLENGFGNHGSNSKFNPIGSSDSGFTSGGNNNIFKTYDLGEITGDDSLSGWKLQERFDFSGHNNKPPHINYGWQAPRDKIEERRELGLPNYKDLLQIDLFDD